jgi:hypothetical protein
MREIIKDDAGHAYTVDGVPKPSVTDLCAIYGDEPDEYLDDAMERAADRGVTMHTVLELALVGEDYTGEYPAIYQPWVDAIEAFLGDYEIVPIAVEQPIYSDRLGVCGTPDLLCLFRKRGDPDAPFTLAILDWKFVSAINKPKVKAQLNGYLEIENDNGVYPEYLAAVQFMSGKYRIYPVGIGGDEWATAVKANEIKNRKYGRGKID